MPHYPKPFFRKSRGLWYVQIDGAQHNLGPDRDAAFAAYRDLMAQPARQPVRADATCLLIDQFLEWVEKNRAPETYVWYQSRLQLFVQRYPALRVADLKPFHVQQWIDAFEVSSGTKRNYARSIIRCLNWCEEQGLVDRLPLRHFKKPKGAGGTSWCRSSSTTRSSAACRDLTGRT
jgi:hypothetical protein